MPASRSRTDRWKELLHQIRDRGGGIEFSIARPDGSAGGPDLVWRVRLLEVSDSTMMVEQPMALNRMAPLRHGTKLLGVLVVGQNRWMFHTSVLESNPGSVLLAMPESVERCSRREFLRISTAELALPEVECWPLLDPCSVAAAEAANRVQVQESLNAGAYVMPPESPLLPLVGPKFGAKLLNIGGGGVGLLVARDEAAAAQRTRMMWLRVGLMPQIPAPLAMTVRSVHTHLDSAQNLYMGAALEFTYNPSHREFVVQQLTGYVAALQGTARAA